MWLFPDPAHPSVTLFESRSARNKFGSGAGTLLVDDRRQVSGDGGASFQAVQWRNGRAPDRCGTHAFLSTRNAASNEVVLASGEAFLNPSPLHKLLRVPHRSENVDDGDAVLARCTCKGFRIHGIRDATNPRPCAHMVHCCLSPVRSVVERDGARWMVCKDSRLQVSNTAAV